MNILNEFHANNLNTKNAIIHIPYTKKSKFIFISYHKDVSEKTVDLLRPFDIYVVYKQQTLLCKKIFTLPTPPHPT